jgi:hypothetical protein
MDDSRFDRWTQLFANPASRRRILFGLFFGASGSLQGAWESAAGPGCKNVGKKCKNAGQCCSGVCKGKKGKKKCKAHDAQGCKAGPDVCGEGDEIPCTTTTGDEGFCVTTTGNAGYCAADGDCAACTKDVDCQALFGPLAACIACIGCEPDVDTQCVGPDAP